MACGSSLHEGQIPISCQLCEEDYKIRYRCKDCSLLMCKKCKEKIHPKIKNAADHRIIDIKEIVITDKVEDLRFCDIKCQDHESQPCCMYCKTCNKLICLKCIAEIHNGHTFVGEDAFHNKRNIASEEIEKLKASLNSMNLVETTEKPELKIKRKFKTDLKDIHFITATANHTLWIGDSKKHKIQNVRLTDRDIHIVSNFYSRIYDMAVKASDDILLSLKDTSLKQIRKNESEIINTKYNVSPLITLGIHVTKDNKVIIGARSQGPPFPRSGKRVVVVMDQEGKPIKEYEYDRNKKPLFTFPHRVTSTSNGNIFVVDLYDETYSGQVVTLSQMGDVISVYKGHEDIYKNKSFSPRGIVTTQLDNVIITDADNHCLPILNSSGEFISYFRIDDIHPYSISVSGSNKLYIGCGSSVISPDTFRSKLYELEYSGF